MPSDNFYDKWLEQDPKPASRPQKAQRPESIEDMPNFTQTQADGTDGNGRLLMPIFYSSVKGRLPRFLERIAEASGSDADADMLILDSLAVISACRTSPASTPSGTSIPTSTFSSRPVPTQEKDVFACAIPLWNPSTTNFVPRRRLKRKSTARTRKPTNGRRKATAYRNRLLRPSGFSSCLPRAVRRPYTRSSTRTANRD